MGESILVIAAHPDDEVLGCGGTLAKYSKLGAKINIIFIADGVTSRGKYGTVESELNARRNAAIEAGRILGVQDTTFYDFPDNRLDGVEILEIIKIIELNLEKYKSDTVITHFYGDLNIDHRQVSKAVATACRPFPGSLVKRMLMFETSSSTEWQVGSAKLFNPNVFVDISSVIDTKFQALEAYKNEMRKWPHSRSLEAIKYLALWRGATVGVEAAESFMLGRQIE